MTQNLPAYLQNRQAPSRNLAATLLGNLGSGSPPFISIRNNKFTAVDSTGAEKPIGGYNQQPDPVGAMGPYIDVVIADSNEHTSKVWFEKAFDPNGDWVPPDCWSDNGIGPSRNASKPQSLLCSTCPKNVWGSEVSKVSGKGVKACHDVQKLAAVVPGDDIVYQFRLPPNSRTNLRNYMLKFQGQPFDLADVVTRVWFDQNTIGTLLFAAVGFIDEATMAQRDKALAEKKTDMLVGRGDVPVQQALPAPAAVAPSPLTAPYGAPNSQPVSGDPYQTMAQHAVAPAPQAPFAPAAAVPQAIPSTAQPVASAAPAANSASAEPQRRRRRTNAQIAADNAAAAPAPQAPATPLMAPFATQAPAAAPAPNFGIQQGLPPNADVMSALNSVFGTPK